MKYRYNIFSFVQIDGNKTYIKNPHILKTIIISNEIGLSDFLNHISKNIFFGDSEIKKYGISKTIIKLLLGLKIIDNYNNASGIELFSFNQLTKNPNFLQEKPDYKYVDYIYKNLGQGINNFLGTGFSTVNVENKNLKFSIENIAFDNIKSNRLKKTYKSKTNVEILDIIKFIFNKRNNGDENKFYFGSGGGLNSIFPIIISKNDEIFVYDKYYKKYYIKKIKNIWQKIKKNGFVKCETKFGAYDYFIFLISDTNNVTEKYGNKAYRLIFLEAGEISFLFRLLSSKFDKAQLEIQGFYDDLIMKIFMDENILNKNKAKPLMLLHTLALSK